MIRYRTSHTEFKKNKAYKGIEFNLDKETFIKWFQERDFENASVDRIDKNKGYTMDNIQLISLAENIRKDKGPMDVDTVERLISMYNTGN